MSLYSTLQLTPVPPFHDPPPPALQDLRAGIRISNSAVLGILLPLLNDCEGCDPDAALEIMIRDLTHLITGSESYHNRSKIAACPLWSSSLLALGSKLLEGAALMKTSPPPPAASEKEMSAMRHWRNLLNIVSLVLVSTVCAHPEAPCAAHAPSPKAKHVKYDCDPMCREALDTSLASIEMYIAGCGEIVVIAATAELLKRVVGGSLSWLRSRPVGVSSIDTQVRHRPSIINLSISPLPPRSFPAQVLGAPSSYPP